jgi:hypothetical protein
MIKIIKQEDLMERVPNHEYYVTLGTIRDTLRYILILDVSESAFTFLNILETGLKKLKFEGITNAN